MNKDEIKEDIIAVLIAAMTTVLTIMENSYGIKYINASISKNGSIMIYDNPHDEDSYGIDVYVQKE